MLELEHVSKRYRQADRVVEVLSDVSLQMFEREVIAIWGLARSGRSALLRIAAGVEAPDSGLVRFRGRELIVGDSARTGEIAYCPTSFHGLDRQPVLDELIAAQLARGVRHSTARERAFAALERAGARTCEARRPRELERAEQVRVGIARALLQEPALIVIDDPTKSVDLMERDKILDLLRSLADEQIAILMSLDNGTGLFAADRALSLGEGRLRGHAAPELAPVVQMPLRVTG